MTIARTRGQRRRLEWSLLAIALLALVAWLSVSTNLGGANHLVQDAGLRLVAAAPRTPRHRHRRH